MKEAVHCVLLGAGRIAQSYAQALAGSQGLQAVAVVDVCADAAEKLAQTLGCPGYQSLDELLAGSPNVEAAIVCTPPCTHRELTLRLLEQGWHVLCEKPCAPHAADVKEMVDICRQHNVQFMDGVMFMHSARLPKMREALDDGASVGAIKRIASQFSFFGGEEFHKGNIRVSRELEPLGALGDLGWYNIRFTLWAMQYQLPKQVSGRSLTTTSEGVPLAMLVIDREGDWLHVRVPERPNGVTRWVKAEDVTLTPVKNRIVISVGRRQLRVLDERPALREVDWRFLMETVARVRAQDWAGAERAFANRFTPPDAILLSPGCFNFLRALIYSHVGRADAARECYERGMAEWRVVTAGNPAAWERSDLMRWRREAEAAMKM